MPDEIRKLCRLADVASKSILLQIARQSDPEKMVALVEQVTQSGMTRADARRAAPRRTAARTKPFAYRYVAPSRAFSLRLQFRKAQVSQAELLEALEEIVAQLRGVDKLT